jgi:hypothetical protein
MLKPGTLIGDSLEAGTMARAIEDAMVAEGIIDLDDETPEAAEKRRKTFIAISTGVINHLKTSLEVRVTPDRFGTNIPNFTAMLTGANGDIS